MAELIKINPVFSPLYAPDALSCNAIFSRKFWPASFIFADLAHLGFADLIGIDFITTATGAVIQCICTISTLRVIPKILQSVIRAVAIIVTDVKAGWFRSKKRHRDDLSYRDLCNDIVLRQRDFDVTSRLALRFQDSPISPSSNKRSDPAQVTRHVESIVSRHHFPQFVVHNTMI